MVIKLKNFILILILYCSNLIYPQSDKITGDKFKDLIALLPEGNLEVQMMDAYSDNPRYYKILQIIDSTFMDDPEWADEYFKNIEEYGPFKFNPKFGLTKEEFEEYLKLDEEHKLISSGSQKLEIIHNKPLNLITFKGNEKLKLLNKIVIDFKNEKLYYEDLEFKFFNEEFISEKQSTLKTDMKGYVWNILNHDEHIIYIEDDNNSSFHNVSFSINQLKENGKTSISIFETIVHGKGICQTSRNELLIMF